MVEIELFIRKRLNPIYRLHYALWVHWWPWWRRLFSGRQIQRQWQRFGLVYPGQTFLDYGCGTGYFSLAAAGIVGDTGKVYALDCFSRQLDMVRERSRKAGLRNIETVLSDCTTGLAEGSIDLVWMCDVLHEIADKRMVLQEMYRVLRPGGVLAIHDSMRHKLLAYTHNLFILTQQDDMLLIFNKNGD